MPELLAYYYPQYHPDPRNDLLLQPGWTEWDLLASAQPRFSGHRWPRRPSWGADSEAEPEEAVRKVEAAICAGIDGFVVDWYWYDDGPFLNRFLDQGLVPVAEDADFRFALMFANHPWANLFPAQPAQETWFEAPTSRKAFECATQHVIDRYLMHPAYWRIDGRAYFSLYDVPDLITAQGGVDATRALLDGFRARAAKAGVELHLNLVSSRFIDDRLGVLAALGADSTTHYTWWHHDDHAFEAFPSTPYADVAAQARTAWSRYLGEPTTYLPNVTVGWDPSPRTLPWANDRDRGYPYTSVIADRSPEVFGEALRDALDVAERAGAPAVLINAWNEWTEDSYLEPDDLFGTAYLDTVAEVTGAGAARRGAHT